MPQANKGMIQMYSVMAEWERDQISARTKAALAAAKGRGVILGAAGPANLRRNIEQRQERSEEHTSELQSLMRISYAVFCLKKKKKTIPNHMKTKIPLRNNYQQHTNT